MSKLPARMEFEDELANVPQSGGSQLMLVITGVFVGLAGFCVALFTGVVH